MFAILEGHARGHLHLLMAVFALVLCCAAWLLLDAATVSLVPFTPPPPRGLTTGAGKALLTLIFILSLAPLLFIPALSVHDVVFRTFSEPVETGIVFLNGAGIAAGAAPLISLFLAHRYTGFRWYIVLVWLTVYMAAWAAVIVAFEQQWVY